jgi:hypothetical protein
MIEDLRKVAAELFLRDQAQLFQKGATLLRPSQWLVLACQVPLNFPRLDRERLLRMF